MKEKVKMIQKTYFVADDGTEFEDEYDCAAHEMMIRTREAKKRIEKIPSFSFTPEFVGSGGDWKWYYVSSDEELRIVKDWESIEEWPTSECSFDSYPCWVAVSTGYDNESQIEGSASEVIDRLHECEANLRKIMEEKERAM